MKDDRDISNRERWAYFGFSVIGPLLSAPPEPGELRAELERLAARTYKHPINGNGVVFGLSTLG